MKRDEEMEKAADKHESLVEAREAIPNHAHTFLAGANWQKARDNEVLREAVKVISEIKDHYEFFEHVQKRAIEICPNAKIAFVKLSEVRAIGLCARVFLDKLKAKDGESE